MGVVELEDVGIGEGVEGPVSAMIASHRGLKPGGNEEVLLAEAKHPAMLGGIIGI